VLRAFFPPSRLFCFLSNVRTSYVLGFASSPRSELLFTLETHRCGKTSCEVAHFSRPDRCSFLVRDTPGRLCRFRRPRFDSARCFYKTHQRFRPASRRQLLPPHCRARKMTFAGSFCSDGKGSLFFGGACRLSAPRHLSVYLLSLELPFPQLRFLRVVPHLTSASFLSFVGSGVKPFLQYVDRYFWSVERPLFVLRPSFLSRRPGACTRIFPLANLGFRPRHYSDAHNLSSPPSSSSLLARLLGVRSFFTPSCSRGSRRVSLLGDLYFCLCCGVFPLSLK